MATVPRLITRRRGATLGLLGLNGLLQSAAALGIAVLGSRLLGSPPNDAIAPGSMVEQGSFGLMAAILVAATIALVGLRVVQRRWAEAFALDYVKTLRGVLFAHVLALPKTSPKLRYGLVMTRLLNDLSAVKLWLAHGLAAVLASVCVVVPILVFLAVHHPMIALGLAPGLGLWGLVVFLAIGPLRASIRESRKRRGKLAAFSGSALSSRLALQHLGRSGPTLRTIERRSDRLNAALVRRATFSGVLRSSAELLYPAMILGVTVLVGSGAASTIDPASLGLAFLLTGILALHLNGVALAADYRLGHLEAMRRIETILSEPTLEGEGDFLPSHAPNTARGSGPRLEIDRATVRPDGRGGDAGVEFNLTIEPGEIVWLNSEAGAASRLLEIVAGIEPMEAGEIRIDGASIRGVEPRLLRRNATLISPAIPLVRGSLDENLMLGAPSTTTGEELQRIKRRLGLDPAPAGAPEQIGDGARCDAEFVSRVTAARGLLRHAGLVLIDDAIVLERNDIMEPLMDELLVRGATVLVNAG